MLVYLAEADVPRYLTAISRRALSVPMRLLRRAGLARGTILDFGCGKGDDVAALRRAGLDARGYDPHYAPDTDLTPADTVNVGYVLNVIEDPAERLRVLRRAWRLTRRHLGVGVRVDAIDGRASGDGVITGSGTFQKSYSTKELRALVRGVTGVEPRVLAPGVVVATRPVAEELSEAQIARLQYHGTTWDRVPAIIAGGLRASADPAHVATLVHRVPTISTCDSPDLAAHYGGRSGAVLEFRVRPGAKYLNRSVRGQRRGESLLDMIERFVDDAIAGGYDGVHLDHLQGTIGNQTINGQVLEFVRVLNPDMAPAGVLAAT